MLSERVYYQTELRPSFPAKKIEKELDCDNFDIKSFIEEDSDLSFDFDNFFDKNDLESEDGLPNHQAKVDFNLITPIMKLGEDAKVLIVESNV